VLDCKSLNALRGIGDPLRDYRFRTYMDTITGIGQLKGEGLLNILRGLPCRNCTLSRDIVYSVLFLASEGPKISVDYGSSDLAVYSQVMQVCESSICICSAGLIASALAWESAVDSLPEKGTTKITMFTYAISRYFRPNESLGVECSACRQNSASRCRFGLSKRHTWSLGTLENFETKIGAGHSFCLKDICSSIQNGHLYLSTTAPTEGRIFWARLDSPSGIYVDVGDGVSITRANDGVFFRVEIDPTSDFYKAIYHSEARDLRQNCGKARRSESTFTVRSISHGNDEPNFADSRSSQSVFTSDPEPEHTAAEAVDNDTWQAERYTDENDGTWGNNVYVSRWDDTDDDDDLVEGNDTHMVLETSEMDMASDKTNLYSASHQLQRGDNDIERRIKRRTGVIFRRKGT
jgi:hypothetical protein